MLPPISSCAPSSHTQSKLGLTAIVCLPGEFIRKDLIRPGLSLEGSLTYPLEEEERGLFIDLIRRMVQWLPEDRAAAGELLKHPYFASVIEWNSMLGEGDGKK